MNRAEQTPEIRSHTLLENTQELSHQGPPHYLNRTGLRSCFVTIVRVFVFGNRFLVFGKTFLLDSLLKLFVFGKRFLLDALLGVFVFRKTCLLD